MEELTPTKTEGAGLQTPLHLNSTSAIGSLSPMAIAIEDSLWCDSFLHQTTDGAQKVAGLKKLKRELMSVFTELFSLGLTISSRFLAEQSTGMEVEADDGGDEQEKGAESGKEAENERIRAKKEEDVLQLAKAYYNLKEYKRCARVLEKCSSHQATFLHYFSLYLAGEKRKEEETLETAEHHPVQNEELQRLRKELALRYEAKSLDGLCLYVYGVVLKELNQKPKAKQILSESVHLAPWNWSAWVDLASLCMNKEDITKLDLPNHVMRDFFFGHLYVELQLNTDSLRVYSALSNIFPNSQYILAQTAIANYNLRDFDVAEESFELLQQRDPYRLSSMDIYSNILYVKAESAKLSLLAHRANAIDKFREETCCIIGNYYSLKSEHQKAVTCFSRALKLNAKYLSAWTLMGHEFLEMKNTPAAVRAYRKAVEVNARDYRAWYGLGQTYEILKMPLYALYYYRKATTLRPYDARMWCAMAKCYESLPDKQEEAIKCYERAEGNTDREGIALNALAKLYQEQGDIDKAAFYYKRNLEHRDKEKEEGQDTVDALMFLAQYCKNKGTLEEAASYCYRLLDYAGREKEEAKALLREISSTTAVKMSGVSFSEDILLDDDDEQEELEEGGAMLGEDLEDEEDGGEALQEGQW